MESDDDKVSLLCGVCQELNYPPFLLVPCGHSFCGNCCIRLAIADENKNATTYLQDSQSGRRDTDRRPRGFGYKCPYCRDKTLGPPIPNIALKQIIEADTKNQDARKERKSDYEIELARFEEKHKGLRNRHSTNSTTDNNTSSNNNSNHNNHQSNHHNHNAGGYNPGGQQRVVWNEAHHNHNSNDFSTLIDSPTVKYFCLTFIAIWAFIYFTSDQSGYDNLY